MMFDASNHPHRLRNSLPDPGFSFLCTGPHPPQHDPDCYLCPGNRRVSGESNPDCPGTFVFTNDFAALAPDTPEPPRSGDTLFETAVVRGTSRVI